LITTSPGEYITEVQAYAAPGFGGGAAVTDWELGSIQTSSAVPEPASFSLVCMGTFGLVIAAIRRLR